MSESPEKLSACRAVCNELKFRMLAARQNWKGFACVGIMKDWNHVSKYSPKWVQWIPGLLMFGKSYRMVREFSIFFSKRPTLSLVPAALSGSLGYQMTRDFLTFRNIRDDIINGNFNMPDSTARKYFLLCFDNNLSDEKERTQAEFIVQKIFETHPDRRTFLQYITSNIIYGCSFLIGTIFWALTYIFAVLPYTQHIEIHDDYMH